MKKVVILLVALVLSVTVLAGKRRPIHLGHYDRRVVNPFPKRSVMRAPVSAFQEENTLQLCAGDDVIYSLCFLDESDKVLSEECFRGSCNVSLPKGAKMVVAYVEDDVFIGILD